jgi:imidazoleglycerol-phosphate dehydratase
MREAVIERETNETNVKVRVNLDSKAKSAVSTGIGFLDHMLELFAFRAGITLEVSCKGDTFVDGHHSAEDVGIALGLALKEALCDKAGIARYGHVSLPMDEALVHCALDISGRPYLVFNAELPSPKVGDFDTELTVEFFRALAYNGGMTLHINLAYGANTHHIIEGIFKAFGCAFGQAIALTGGGIPSTKGIL